MFVCVNRGSLPAEKGTVLRFQRHRCAGMGTTNAADTLGVITVKRVIKFDLNFHCRSLCYTVLLNCGYGLVQVQPYKDHDGVDSKCVELS